MIRYQPDPALAQAVRHHQAGRIDKAEAIYRQVLNRQPGNAEVLHQLGILSARKGETGEAEAFMRRAIDVRPDFADALANLGNVLIAREKFPEATDILERSRRLRPDNALALSNLSFALRMIGRFDESVATARRALAIAPDHPDPLNNLGSALVEVERFEEARDCFARASARDPNSAAIHLNLAHALLRLGNFERGWAEYEWRLKQSPTREVEQTFAEPRWDGRDLRGRVILLYSEQGLGDTIQFLRFVPQVIRRGGRVLLRVQPALQRLAATSGAVSQVITTDPGPRPPAQVRCPLMSLPFMLGIESPEQLRNDKPYLRSDAAATQRWCERLAAEPAGPKVGIAWAGNPKFGRDRERSIPPAALTPLASLPDAVRFYSLKKRDADSPAVELPFAMTDRTDELTDFAETAAFMMGLDVVIAVDTAAAHLAGALGKEVWLLLPRMRDWRWMLENESTPWYPTMRLIAQDRRDDWSTVIERVAADLRQRVNPSPAKTG